MMNPQAFPRIARNYEIYIGDIVNLLQLLENQGGRQQVDSTEYQAYWMGNMLHIVRAAKQVGHVRISVVDNVLRVGELSVLEQYRKSGVSLLLMFIALIHGVRQGADRITLNEDSEVQAYRFWARLGIQVTAGREVPLAGVFGKFEGYQTEMAEKLGLYRTPNTLLLNVNYPEDAGDEATPATRTRSSSFSGSSYKSLNKSW